MIELTPEQIARFQEDGFLILERFIDPGEAARVAARYEDLFRGRFETGLYPDEWNWQEGRDPPDRTRQICNGWKSDRTVAGLVLRAEIGRLVATLAGWPGARLAQDNVIWKPPGAKPLGFHQDDSYTGWIQPAHMLTCWMALDQTTAAGGTIEYVRGSHKWPVSPPIKQFHAPDDYRREMREAAAAVGLSAPELVPVEVPPGGCAFHDGRTWHGSDRNGADRPRRSAVSHCMSSEARFHPTNVSYIYNRYKRVGDETMDESFFPILWRQDGYRTPFLDDYIAKAPAAAEWSRPEEEELSTMDSHPAVAAGRVAVVTGAASGIGRAAARRFAALGLHVCLADLAGEALDRAAAEAAEAAGGKASVRAVPCDVSRLADVERLREEAYGAFGEVGLLMNNAGIGNGAGPWEKLDRWRRILEVNLWGVIHGVQVFAPRMIAAGKPGAIVNTGSKQGITTPPGDAAYNVSKAGVKVVTEQLAHGLRNAEGAQVTAHLLIPGFTFTGMTKGARTEKPAGAWSADQVVDFMLPALARGDFYILCPDNDTPRATDEKRMRWAADDVILNRPALSRWHPDYKDAFAQFLQQGKD